MSPANIKRSGTLQRLIEETTDEDKLRWKKERLERKEKLTAEYQLGYFVGEKIVDDFLPTLDTDGITSRHVIKVSDEDRAENKMLEEDWYESTRYGKNWDGENEKGNKSKWDAYFKHNKMLEEKYLPEILECYLPVLNLRNEEDFKEGLIDNLWNCDMCCYELKPELIEIVEDEALYFTIIKFKRCQQDIPQGS